MKNIFLMLIVFTLFSCTSLKESRDDINKFEISKEITMIEKVFQFVSGEYYVPADEENYLGFDHTNVREHLYDIRQVVFIVPEYASKRYLIKDNREKLIYYVDKVVHGNDASKVLFKIYKGKKEIGNISLKEFNQDREFIFDFNGKRFYIKSLSENIRKEKRSIIFSLEDDETVYSYMIKKLDFMSSKYNIVMDDSKKVYNSELESLISAVFMNDKLISEGVHYKN